MDPVAVESVLAADQIRLNVDPASTICLPMTTRQKPLLAVGNDAEWARISEEVASQEAEFAASLSMNERVTYGQKLSQQAVSLLVASVEAGHAPRRAFWT